MEALIASISVRGVPLEVWITLPVVILALYAIFRWQKFGEDSFTWNHKYFQRAVAFGFGVWILSYLSTLPPEYWQRALIWVVVSIIAILAMDYWGGEGIFPAARLTLLMVLVGVTVMPLPRVIGHFVYGDFEPNRKTADGVVTRHFLLQLKDGWQSLAGHSPRTYRSARAGAGFLQVSMYPPLEGTMDGERAEKQLDQMLKEISGDLKIGPPLTNSHGPAKNGVLAFAKYRSDEHGVLGFWLIPTPEATIFASYTDGSPAAAEADIRECQEMLSTGGFL